MIAITVKTPFDKDLTLAWKDRKVEVNGDKEARMYWDILKRRGLGGKYGHTLDLNDCFFQDLVIAVATAAGPDSYTLSPDAEKQLAKEIEDEKRNPIPEGATS